MAGVDDVQSGVAVVAGLPAVLPDMGSDTIAVSVVALELNCLDFLGEDVIQLIPPAPPPGDLGKHQTLVDPNHHTLVLLHSSLA